MNLDRSQNLILWSVIAGLVLFIVCCCLVGILFFGAGWYVDQQISSVFTQLPPLAATPQVTIKVIRPTSAPLTPTAVPSLQDTPATPQPTDELVFIPDPLMHETIDSLKLAEIPTRDLLDLAKRLQGKEGISQTVEPRVPPYQIGDIESFWVINSDDNAQFQTTAVLRAQTAHANFWIQEGVAYDPSDLRRLSETFENQIYPTNREFFGSEWTPGVDGEDRLYILFTSGIGSRVAGYYSRRDSIPPALNEYSNAHEMFVMSADNLSLDQEYSYNTLAHEFQHMIHWYKDANEEIWLNEGFAELAAQLNGYDLGGADYLYSLDADIQLNDWPYNGADTSAHYGNSFLFLSYFLDRFGEEATKSLVSETDNGLESIDIVLDKLDATDPLTGNPIRADDFFQDWVITSYLNNSSIGDGRYAYKGYTDAPFFLETERFDTCPIERTTRAVSQYGVDYILFGCPGEFNLHFEGSLETTLLPTDPYSGEYALWSNKGDESDMTLTRTFDFSNINGPIQMNYWTWYDLEQDYDYLYLLALVDGEFWEIIKTPSGTSEDPTGNSYGHGYNGLSGGRSQSRWIEEKVDLSAYAGKVVQLRFEYVTDAASHGEGFLLDDVSIPAAGYFSDFELDHGGWDSAGWVRVHNVLPQTFRLSLLINRWTETEVRIIDLGPDLSVDIPFELGLGDEAVLVVSGTTRFTRQPAGYQFEVRP